MCPTDYGSDMRVRKTRRGNRCAHRQATHLFNRSNPQQPLRSQALESRQLLAADVGGGDPVADITVSGLQSEIVILHG